MRTKVILFLLLLIVGVACAGKVAGPGRGCFLEVGDKPTLIMAKTEASARSAARAT